MKVFFILFLSVSAFSQDFFNVELMAQWTDTTIEVGPGDVRFSDLWGFKVNGVSYAVLGSTEGSHFLKIEDTEITEVDFEKGAFGGPSVQHRDYKQFGNYVYAVCDEGNSSLQIFDISYLPDSVKKVYDSNVHFTICHNIFIDTLKARLYACAPDNFGMKILDISSPESPSLLLNFTNIDYVHDCYVSNDTAFLNAGINGLRVYNFMNVIAPQEIGVLSTYQEKGYNHSGWMNSEKTVYCFVDETVGKKIKFCKLENGIENIEVDALFGTRNAGDFVAHNISIVDGFAFVSYYNEGLRVFDLEQSPIKEVAFYDTYPQDASFKLHGAWGVYVFKEEELIIISDRQTGLYSFYFPFSAFRNLKGQSELISLPFLNTTSKLIIDNESVEDYIFDIYSVNGHIIYRKETVKNWINIPLSIQSGQYLYKLYTANNVLKGTGKFVIVN